MTNETKTPLAAATTAPANTSCSSDMKQNNAKTDTLSIEIKKTWTRLSDDEVKLYADNADQFFAAIKTKYGTDKEEAQKRLTEIKASCGTCTTEKAA
jgi:uncharacterized protein YjbJ (UPF0337 family)